MADITEPVVQPVVTPVVPQVVPPVKEESSTAELDPKTLEEVTAVVKELKEQLAKTSADNEQLKKLNMQLALGIGGTNTPTVTGEETLHNMFSVKKER